MSIISSSTLDTTMTPSLTRRPRTYTCDSYEMALLTPIALPQAPILSRTKVTKPLSATEMVTRIEMLWASSMPDCADVLSSYVPIATLPDHIRYQCYLYQSELFLGSLLSATPSLKSSSDLAKLILKGLNLFLLSPSFDHKDKLVACEFAYTICHLEGDLIKSAEYVHTALSFSKSDIILERMWQSRKRTLVLAEDVELTESPFLVGRQKQIVECVTCLFLLDYRLSNIMIMRHVLNALERMSLSEKARSLALLKVEAIPKDRASDLQFLRIQTSVLVHNRFLPEAIDLIKLSCEKAVYPKMPVPGIHRSCETFIAKWSESRDFVKMQKALTDCSDEDVKLHLCLYFHLVVGEELLIEERIDEAIDLFLTVFEWECPEKWFQLCAFRLIEQYSSYLKGHHIDANFVFYAAEEGSIALCESLIPQIDRKLQLRCLNLYKRLANAYYEAERYEETIKVLEEAVDLLQSEVDRICEDDLADFAADILGLNRSILKKTYADFQKMLFLKFGFIVDTGYYDLLIKEMESYQSHPVFADLEGLDQQKLHVYQALALFYTDPSQESSLNQLKTCLTIADRDMQLRTLNALILFYESIGDHISYEKYKKEALSKI